MLRLLFWRQRDTRPSFRSRPVNIISPCLRSVLLGTSTCSCWISQRLNHLDVQREPYRASATRQRLDLNQRAGFRHNVKASSRANVILFANEQDDAIRPPDTGLESRVWKIRRPVTPENKPLVTSPGHYVYPIICIRIPVFRKLISVDKRASGHWTRFGAGIRGIRFGRNCVLQREHQSNI